MSESPAAEPTELLQVLPPKLAQRLAKKLQNEFTPEKVIDIPPSTFIREDHQNRVPSILDFKTRHDVKSTVNSKPAVPIEHPREWVSNMHGNSRHSSRRFSPERFMQHDLDPPVLATQSRASTTPVIHKNPVKSKTILSKSTPSPLKGGKHISTPSQKLGKNRTPEKRPSYYESDSSPRYVNPHPKVSPQHQSRNSERSRSQIHHSDSWNHSSPEHYSSNLGESILLSEDHLGYRGTHSQNFQRISTNGLVPNSNKNLNRSSITQQKGNVGRRTRSISPPKGKSRPVESPLHRSASADTRMNRYGENIRTQGPPAESDQIQAEITDYLTERIKRSISPERLGKTNIKYLNLKSMNHLLEGLPPSINSLLNNHTTDSDVPRKDGRMRRSSPGTNHRRDVLTDAAEWSRLLDWLDSIGMSKYSNRFRLAGATKLSIVELLAPQDLVQMGISHGDSFKIIQSIQEISRRTRSLTEEALSGSPSIPKRHTPRVSPPVRKLSLRPLTNVQPQLNKISGEGSQFPLLTYKHPSTLSPPSGLVSVPILLQSFDKPDLPVFMKLWFHITSNLKILNVPSDLYQNMIIVDFYLRLNAAISTFRIDSSVESRTNGMKEFKSYLEDCCTSDLNRVSALVNSRLYAAYASVVMVPNPKNNPAFSALFDPKWIRALRTRLIKFLDLIRWVHIPQSLGKKTRHSSSSLVVEQSISQKQDMETAPTVRQLTPPSPPKPPFHHDEYDDSDEGRGSVQQVEKKMKSIKVRKMTAVLGSGPLVIEEVQEEVTDDDEDDEILSSGQSPLQSIKQLSSSSFVPISSKPQTTLLNELQDVESVISPPIPLDVVDIDQEAENYDFSHIHGEPAVEEESSHQQTEPQIESLSQSKPEPQQDGYYDEMGNWRYYNYQYGYYDPSGVWHESGTEQVCEMNSTTSVEMNGEDQANITTTSKSNEQIDATQWCFATLSSDQSDEVDETLGAAVGHETIPGVDPAPGEYLESN